MLLFNLIYLMLSFHYLINIKIINEILRSFFHTASSKSGMYFTLRTHLHSDLSHCKCSIATHGWWLPCWTAQVQKIEASAKTSCLKNKKARWALAIQEVTKNKVKTQHLVWQTAFLRFFSLIFPLPWKSVYRCCFTVPRSEIDIIGFTVMWNKAIGEKLKASWGSGA